MKYGLHKQQYSDLLYALSLMIYARCVDYGGGIAVFEHFAENGFEMPCELLANVGIMRTEGTYPSNQDPHRHAFVEGWSTATKVKLERNPAKSEVVEVLVALCFLVDWSKADFSEISRNGKLKGNPPKLNIVDQWRFNSSQQRAFEKYAYICALDQLAKAGLVRWQSTGGFELIVSSEGDPPIDFAEAASVVAQKYAAA
ncbi:MAG: hypothetical protein AAGE80_15370 [Pseudomonadota bacterium]